MRKKVVIILVILSIAMTCLSAALILSKANNEPSGIQVITSEESAIAISKVYLQRAYPEYDFDNEKFSFIVLHVEDYWRVMPYDIEMEMNHLPAIEITETGEVLRISLQADLIRQ